MSKQVALVLGSDGAHDYVHIDVIEELGARGYEITYIIGCSIGPAINSICATGKLCEYREQVESLSYLDILRLLDVNFRPSTIRGERMFDKIHKILGGVDIENLPIPYTAVVIDLTNQQEIWFQEDCLHQTMCAPATVPDLFTPVVQDSRVLVGDGLLNPLPIVPVVPTRSDLIIAVNLSATNQKQYHLPAVGHPATLKGRFDSMIESPGHKLSFPHRHGDDNTPLELSTDTLLHSVPTESEEPVEPQLQQPAAAPQGRDSPKSASGTTMMGSSDPASLPELVNQSFEMMQTLLAQYKIAGYPPSILINVSKRVCHFFEFYKAPELIALGRQIIDGTLDHHEEDNT